MVISYEDAEEYHRGAERRIIGRIWSRRARDVGALEAVMCVYRFKS